MNVIGGNREGNERVNKGERERKETEVLYTGRDDCESTIEVIRIHTRMKEALRRVCLKESR